MGDDRPSSGLIHHVTGVDANGYGRISDIRYWIVFSGASGATEPQGPVQIANRRPSSVGTDEIRAAMPGDVVSIAWFGTQFACQVIEGLDDRERCTG